MTETTEAIIVMSICLLVLLVSWGLIAYVCYQPDDRLSEAAKFREYIKDGLD